MAGLMAQLIPFRADRRNPQESARHDFELAQQEFREAWRKLDNRDPASVGRWEAARRRRREAWERMREG
jgi:hypothetical protein